MRRAVERNRVWSRWRDVAALIAAILATVPLSAQDEAASPEPSFEVVSVKPNVNDAIPEAISLSPDGSIRFTAFPARTLITMAYRSEGLQRFDQLVGAPSWLAADRFDIVGKAGDPGTRGALQSSLPMMLRALLRDRFHLRVHSTARSIPAFALVLAQRDGQLGPQLHRSTVECPTEGAADAERWCGIRAAGGVITGRAVSATQLAGNLSGYPEVDRFVSDRTSLAGLFDFDWNTLRPSCSPLIPRRTTAQACSPR